LVYIKRIDLRGFKTFGKKTTINLGRGLTIITGPNGSGKSNILDSVKFALGELSPKELRGETISDLVHKGPQHAGTKTAYVAVQFDNHDRRIPIDSENVTISREFRRGGEGVYRVNGKRTSRKQLTDILSSADIQGSSYNIVPQHAITRLADVSSEERRKIIEDMVGIAIYDVKRTAAQAELQQAEINLKIASAKIDEVKQRVASLKKERNDYLKHNELQKQITALKSAEISCKIRKAQRALRDTEEKISANKQHSEELRNKKELLLEEKSKLHSAKKKLEDTLAEKTNRTLLDVRRSLGDASTKVASLRTYAHSTDANVKLLQDQIVNLESKSRETTSSAEGAEAEIQRLTLKLNDLNAVIVEKRRSAEQYYEGVEHHRHMLGEGATRAENLERKTQKITHRLIKTDGQVKASTTKIELLENSLQGLTYRIDDQEQLRDAVNERMAQLKEIHAEQASRNSANQTKVVEYKSLADKRRTEIQQAKEVCKRAAEALTEIEAQSEVAENFASEDKALKTLEELSEAGAIQNVYGRLADLVNINEQYGRAMHAAAGGWMKAIVVRDLETALTCIEAMKKIKVGRVKVIPIEGLAATKKCTADTDQEIVSPIIEQMTFDEKLRPAVNYVFGDTILTLNQKSALLASLKGQRAVAVSGDLYEPEGAMETGYFRENIDVTQLLLNGTTVKHIKKTLASLSKLAGNAEENLEALESEVQELDRATPQTRNFLKTTENEIATTRQHQNRIDKTLEEAHLRMLQTKREIETERTILEASLTLHKQLHSQLVESEETKKTLEATAQSTALHDIEERHVSLTNELNELIKQKVENESQLSTLNSTLTMLQASRQQAQQQAKELETQITELKTSLLSTSSTLLKAEEELRQLESTKHHLTDELAAIKRGRDDKSLELAQAEGDLTRTLDELDRSTAELNTLAAANKNIQMQIEFGANELREMGLSEPLRVKATELEAIQTKISELTNEMNSIGAVNELAIQQYGEVAGNYKHLASRIQDLENEKLSILQFMNELDQQKLETFTKAFNQVSKSFAEIFSTVTSGTGRLYLEKPESPFEAGADIRLQFPGKTEMTIGSASGGEKSVGTVCFILALQSIHPMPFYMMDEVDAHLDVLNSQRLAELLKARSQGSQFVVVSLKDVTITRGDAVYGVFIQEGVSQVMSLPLQEAKVAGRAK
jgi:chromosome segregation protein